MNLRPALHKLKEMGPYLLIGGPLFAIGVYLLQGAPEDAITAATVWVLGLGLVLVGGLIIAYPIAEHLFGGLAGGLFWPHDEIEPTPMYGIPETLIRKGEFEAALREYEKITDQYPKEIKPWIGMLEITLQRLNDRPRAETIHQRGLLRLTSEEGRATLTRVYEALLTQPAAPDTTPLTARSKAASTAAATARPGTPSPDQPDLRDRSIRVEHNPYPTKLERLGVKGWPIWEKEISEFPWHYDDRETCYLLEGDVTVTPDGGGAHRFGKGDLVTFPKGLSCTWKIHVPVRKHYRFG